ncbi:MAG TPA: AMP-binding protein, partial [Bacillota bacterium]|nr:AMP-binding protein [Bacillota bacterium]
MITEIHKEYLTEKIGNDGNVESCGFIVPEKFNFAYDIADRIALEDPRRRAMHWSNEAGEKHVFSFGDIKEQSDRAAAYFQSLGIGKGDRVMLILKRHYQFWFAIMGLHK